jgi:hypothetical protein
MSDWEEDDWEGGDLKMPDDDAADAKKEKGEWSDEEGHDPSKDVAPVIVGEAGAKAEKSGLALKIEEREKREADEAERKEKLREKIQPTPDMKGLKGKALEKAKQKAQMEVRAARALQGGGRWPPSCAQPRSPQSCTAAPAMAATALMRANSSTRRAANQRGASL